MKNKKVLVALSVLILGALFTLSIFFYKSQESERIAFLAQEDFSTFVPKHAPTLGTATPKVYLVEFLDPECESCRMFHSLTKQLMQEFDGKVQLVIRYAPFHGNSVEVVKILEAARKQGKYWETLEVLFQYQPQWGSHHDPRPDLIWKYLPEAGVNLDQIKTDMNDPQIQDNLDIDIKDGQTLGVRRTPQFFINGKALEQFGYEFLRQEIINAL